MKKTYTIGVASALLLAAGCAHEEQSARTNETGYSSGRVSEPNYSYAAPSLGGSYSADGSYSSGGGGAYATPGEVSAGGNYSGTVGADGTYTPYANSGAVAGGYANGVGADSDSAVVAQVRDKLRQDPELALIMPNIQINAHNGAVILNGSVQSEEQKRQIAAQVQNVTGVVAVNNQLNVMAGANGQNPNGLYPTGSDSPRLYKDAANGPDTSSNNALNATSRPNQGTQLYQQGNSILDTNLDDSLWQNGVQPNNDSLWVTNSGNQMSPTSRSNSPSQIYHEGTSQQQDLNNLNSSSNIWNSSTNLLIPTSREGGSRQIYQNSPGEKLPSQNSNNIQSP